jgi:hypothetical protein
MSQNEKNIIDPTKYQKRVIERRRAWTQGHKNLVEEYPSAPPDAHQSDESMKHAYSVLSLRRALFRYMEQVHPNEEFGDEVIRQFRRLDKNVRIMTDELDERMQEDEELSRYMPSPEVVSAQKRESTQKIIKHELENAMGTTEGGSSPALVLIDRAGLNEESEIANNPSRFYEQSMTQQLQRQMGRELKKAFEPKRERLRKPESDSVSEELDNPSEQRQPTGKFKDVVGVAEQEITAAISRLLPADNYLIAEKVRKEYDEYLARKVREAYES